MLEAKYVIISPPSRMHLIYREDIEEFQRRLNHRAVPVLAVNSLNAEDTGGKWFLSDDFRALPKGLLFFQN
jgi:hypothetical protein